MLGILSLFLVVTLSILITRIAALALTHTGLSRESSRFQARSALTGAGFTTHESEKVVNHPVRRRIVMTLMMVGNAGVITGVTSLILTFVGGEEEALSREMKVLILIGGLVVLWLISTSAWVDRHLSRVIDSMLQRYTKLDVRDYAELLHLGHGCSVAELVVDEDSWLAGKSLRDTRLREEGLVVVGLERVDGAWLGAPKAETEVHPGDTLIIYGRNEAITEIDERRAGVAGDRQHDEAVAEQEAVEEEEEALEEALDEPRQVSADEDG